MPTTRQAIKDLLQEQPLSALEVSQRLSISEKEVLEHLAHIAKAPGPGQRFHIVPSVCNICGFTFKKRDRLATPTRCPICRRQSIRRPRFQITKE
jgi:predicted Zn-ribbon and HTH transcriptional regulator